MIVLGIAPTWDFPDVPSLFSDVGGCDDLQHVVQISVHKQGGQWHVKWCKPNRPRASKLVIAIDSCWVTSLLANSAA